MQLVNMLAFCGVVQKPTVEEMAEWICQNADLGAVAGLKLMGFRVSMPDQIQGSYICFHNVLEHFLTQQDKDEVGFHPPFSEHVLCKTPRWNKYLVADQSDSLVQMADRLEQVLWVSGTNLKDPSAMPFPLFPTLQDLKEVLMNNEDLEVCARMNVLELYAVLIVVSQLDGHNLEQVDELLVVSRAKL